MRIFNTLSGKKEKLETLKPHEVKMYVCGPTTYNYIHLGNARPMVVFDTVRRYMEYRGYQVSYVQNFTDVDDKIINRGREEGEDPLVLSQCYIDEYFKDADALGIRRADIHPRVSEHMPQIIEAVQSLIDKGYAYQVDGDVFYRVRAFSSYGKLSGRTLEDMLSGARIEVDQRKEDPVDFALWKTAKEGEPSWDSPWGKGRPGWHIECSVMATHYLGDTIDIHGGGSDLIFPHHENEIAQAEALTGQPFVRYWMHNGFITVNNEKMSKSLGNFFVLRDILNNYPADVVRFYLIATHYRSPLDFDDGKLEEARRALARLKNTLVLLKEFGMDEEKGPAYTGTGDQVLESVKELEAKFVEAMDDDFNTAKAIGHLFEMAHQINSFLASADRSNPDDQLTAGQSGEVFYKLGDLLGIFFMADQDEEAALEKVLGIFARMRQEARREKDFVLADMLRDYLRTQGVSVEDMDTGSRFRYDAPPAVGDLIEKLIELRATYKSRREYNRADGIRDYLQEAGIVIEDTREGVRWKFVEA